MPSGTALLQSPGWNEGKARYETLGKHIQNEKELRRGAALSARVFVAGSAAPKGAQNMLIDYKPRACALGYAGVSPLQGSSTSSLSLYYFDALTLLVIPPLQNTIKIIIFAI